MSLDSTTLAMGAVVALGHVLNPLQHQQPDDGRTGCAPFLLPPDCTMTYAKFLGRSYTLATIIYAILVICGFIFTSFHAYRTLKAKGFNPFQSVQVRLHVFIFLGMSLLSFRIVDPFGWSKRIPYQVILISYDLSGTATLSIGLDIVFDWLRVTMIADNQFILSSKFRYICMSFQCGTAFALLVLSTLQCTVGPWWLFHSLKTAVYILVSGTMVALFLRYGFKVQRIIKEHEDLRDKQRFSFKNDKSIQNDYPDSHNIQHYYQNEQNLDQNIQNSQNYDVNNSHTSFSHHSPQSAMLGSQSQHQFAHLHASGARADDYGANIDMLAASTTESGYRYTQLQGEEGKTLPMAMGGGLRTKNDQNDPKKRSVQEDHIFRPIEQSQSSSSLDSSESFVYDSRPGSLLDKTTGDKNLKKITKKKKKKQSAGAKVPKLIVLTISMLALMIVLWAYVLYNEVSHQCTVKNSCNLVKDRELSLLFAALYDMVHLSAYVSICLFFGLQKNPKNDQNDEKSTKSAQNCQNVPQITTIGAKSYIIFNDGSKREATAMEISQGVVYDVQNDPFSAQNQQNQQKKRNLFPKSAIHSFPRSNTTSFKAHSNKAMNDGVGNVTCGVSLQSATILEENLAQCEGEKCDKNLNSKKTQQFSHQLELEKKNGRRDTFGNISTNSDYNTPLPHSVIPLQLTQLDYHTQNNENVSIDILTAHAPPQDLTRMNSTPLPITQLTSTNSRSSGRFQIVDHDNEEEGLQFQQLAHINQGQLTHFDAQQQSQGDNGGYY
jgi:hypothetical protein